MFSQPKRAGNLLETFANFQAKQIAASELQPVKCSRCGEEHEETSYHIPTLKYLQQAKRQATCLHCALVHLPSDWRERKTCCVCLQDLSLLAFSASMQLKIRRSQNTKVRCLECQYPQCACCKMHATTMPNSLRAPKTKEERDKYLCLECSYPDCMECGVPMPNWR